MRRQIVNNTGGYIVHRWDLTGERLPSYIRPDVAVSTRPHKKPSKYIYASKSATQRSAKLIDVHPRLWDRLRVSNGLLSEPIHFCLEGCLKADSVAGTGRLAISVPSVTLWELEPQDLAPWLAVLRAAPIVYIVPDSDYNSITRGHGPGERPKFVKGGEVRYFTDLAVRFYRRLHGINVHYLVPPWLTREEASSRQAATGRAVDRSKVGIDDHLAWGGNMEPWDRERNPRGVHTWVYAKREYRRLPRRPRDRADTLDRDARFLDWLEGTHGQHGLFSVQLAARDLRWHRDTVLEAKKSCIDRRILSVWNGPPLGEQRGNKPHVFKFESRGALRAQAP